MFEFVQQFWRVVLPDELSKEFVVGLTRGLHRLEKLSRALVDGDGSLWIRKCHREL